MKTKTNRLCFLCFALAFLLCAPLGLLLGCNNTPALTKSEKAALIINSTSTAINEIDDEIMAEYESSQGEVQPAAAKEHTKEESYQPHTQIDRGSNEHVYNPVSQMTISFGYYALSEYYNEYIPNFIDQLLFVEQTYYPNQNIWSKCELTDSSLEIYIWTEYINGFEEYINITIEYDKHHNATKFTHRENRHFMDSRDYFGYIDVNFKTKECLIETIAYSTNSEIDFKSASDETIKDYMTRYVREEFSLNKYKKRTTSIYANSSRNNLTESQMIAYAKAFDYAYTREGKTNFDFTEAVEFN